MHSLSWDYSPLRKFSLFPPLGNFTFKVHKVQRDGTAEGKIIIESFEVKIRFDRDSACPAALSLNSFEETACFFDVPEGAPVECGFVVVPEDHSTPGGSSIRLATVIVRDQSQDHQPDPVILLAGGPGERTVGNTLQIAPSLAPLHPNRDLILFDQAEASQKYRELMKYILEQAWVLPKVTPDFYTVWWPWIKNYNGEAQLGYLNRHFYNWVWIDQEMKKSMGY